MSILRVYEVWCDLCANWFRCDHATTVEGARQEAKAKGWKMRKSGDRCPRCAKTGGK